MNKPEKKEEFYLESCDNCEAKGYGKAWYGKGQATGDAWGDAYRPTGSVVFCEDCKGDFEIGKEWEGERIWKRTSDLPQHKGIRINSIKRKSLENIGYNQACDEFMKWLPSEEEIGKIIDNVTMKAIRTGKLYDTMISFNKEIAKAIYERLK